MAARVREVVWAESARDALDAVITYIAQESQQAAQQVLEKALRAGASLATFAERGRIVPELNDPTIRELFVFKYRLQYEVSDARVLVVAFLHGSRDFATWQQSQKHSGAGRPLSASSKIRGIFVSMVLAPRAMGIPCRRVGPAVFSSRLQRPHTAPSTSRRFAYT